jgi:hypothetical protein
LFVHCLRRDALQFRNVGFQVANPFTLNVDNNLSGTGWKFLPQPLILGFQFRDALSAINDQIPYCVMLRVLWVE